jgi:peptide/nickel transport system substrate-binding protein
MKKQLRIILTITLLLCISISTVLSYALVNVSPEQEITGPKSDKIEYVRVDQPLAVQAIRDGEIDAYIFNILPDAQVSVETTYADEIELWKGISGMDDLVLNPAPAPEGQLNPFSIREVRYALNFVFDRDFLVNELMQGTAAAMYDYLGPFHPEAPSIADIKLRHGFTYDFELANDMVENAMVLAGAEKRAGLWYYRDEPVVVKALIRVEDERRDMGDAFAADVEKLGFKIEYIHTTFGPAIDTIYGTDPSTFEWSFYTEGWGIGASRWLTFQPAFWGGEWDPDYGYWLGNMPGWGNEEWWNYHSPGDRIETLGTDIYFGRYTDLEDREEKVREITDLIMTEAVRIFGLRLMDAYPASRDLKGLTQDMGNGLRSATWAPREAYKDDTTDLKFGNLWVWTETTVWNRYGGFNDVYSVDIARSTYDPAVWRHPFTASAMPFRATYEVTTEGPEGTLSVPSDAYVWDADADQWVTVGADVDATSMVVFDLSMFTQSKWHHGLDINMADILYSIASGWDIANDAVKSTRESTVSGGASGYYNTIKGLVVDGDDVTVYLDFYHFDDNEIALAANFMGGINGIGDNPWELNAAQDDVVFEKQLAAFDQTAADVYGVPWLSLVLGDHAGIVKDSLEEFLAEDYFPSNYFTLGDTTYDTIENARARYQATIDWYNDKGIIWISNGPFYLNAFDAEAQYAETLAYRDPTYPFKPGDWYYGRPQIPEVVDVTLPVITKGLASTIDITMQGPETLAATYIITTEATGELVLKGEADTTATYGALEVPLTVEDTDLLDIGGRYVMTVLGKSPEVAFLSTATKRFVVRDPLIVGLGEQITEITGNIDILSDRLDETSETLATAIDALSNLIGTTTAQLSSTISEATDDLSSDIGTMAQSVSSTNENISKLVGTTNTLMYAIGATLIVALIGVALSFTKK